MIILHNVPFLWTKDPSIKVYGYNLIENLNDIFNRSLNNWQVCIKPENIYLLIHIDIIFLQLLQDVLIIYYLFLTWYSVEINFPDKPIQRNIFFKFF
ncbi:hypothetical protein SAMN04488025_13313 [Planifilum fulgidum]|uniref:Uncharacterized protein n=1 Tax=Planifilum fulgidum TaxID=201973 RepID=A0A1I2RQ39_9BACL|nr:hypothetical protein SAMN04488025_13313 [Planifilum fulgidum]